MAGDVIVARAPGQCFGSPTRIADISAHLGRDGNGYAWTTLRRPDDSEFEVVAAWDDPLEDS